MVDDCVPYIQGAVLTITALNLVNIITVIVQYRRADRLAHRPYGLTTAHVALVSLGVFIIQATLAWTTLDTIGANMSWQSITRLTLYGVGSMIILVALFAVGKLQRARIRFHERISHEQP